MVAGAGRLHSRCREAVEKEEGARVLGKSISGVALHMGRRKVQPAGSRQPPHVLRLTGRCIDSRSDTARLKGRQQVHPPPASGRRGEVWMSASSLPERMPRQERAG